MGDIGPGGWAAIGAVAMAAINATASVLMLYIRAKYQWRNGKGDPKEYTPQG